MKKIVCMLLSILLVVGSLTVSSSALEPSSRYTILGSYTFDLQDKTFDGLALTSSESPTVTITAYSDMGKRVYRMDTTATTQSEEEEAFEIFDRFINNGNVQQYVVVVDEKDKDFYGTETVRSATSGTGYNAYNFSWAKYNATSDTYGGYDSCWGTQTARWTMLSTNADYIKLHQTCRVNVTGASSTLNIGWPSASVSITSTRSSSSASWDSETEYNAKALSSEHLDVSFNREDICNGYVTSFITTDYADIKYGSVIYKPQSVIRFENGMD